MSGPNDRVVPFPIYAALLVGLFVAITGTAMLAGRWQSSISREDYVRQIPRMAEPTDDGEHVIK